MAVGELVIIIVAGIAATLLAASLVALIVARLPQWRQDRDRVETAGPDYPLSKDLVFRPPSATRWLNSLVMPALLIVVAVALPFSGDTALDVVLTLLPAAAIPILQSALLVLAVALAIRNWRVAVRIVDGVVDVRGVLRDRRIPIEQVTEVKVTGRGPASICWEEPSGRRREADLPGFWAHRMATPVNQDNRAELERLNQAIKANRGLRHPFAGGDEHV